MLNQIFASTYDTFLFVFYGGLLLIITVLIHVSIYFIVTEGKFYVPTPLDLNDLDNTD